MGGDAIRLLLVEDNPGDARLIRELLRVAEPFPLEMKHVERLEEAIEHLGRRETDAVLLDLSLPDAQGMDTVLQTLGAAPGLPVIVLTGLSHEETALQAVHAGAQDYLVKGEITGRLLLHSIRYAIERSRLERERWSLLQREQQARTLAESAVRSRDEVLATVAHDLRNPLAAINTTAALMREGAVPPEQCAHQLEVVLRSTEQMDRLIEDLLDIARIEGGTLRIEPGPIAVQTLLKEAVELLEGQVTLAGLGLRVEAGSEIPDVSADRQRILQVLSNLVANAIRFSPRGGEVTLRARRFGDAVLFSVTDTGVGIPREELPHLFDRSWQVDHARRGGTGRGLSICKGIVAAHRGRIWAASEVGEGSTFFFTLLPAEANGFSEPDEPAYTAPADARVAEEDSRPPLRLLVVDDHPTLRRGLLGILRRSPGVEVVGEAASGEEALREVERLNPDVVLMDLVMPGIGGLEATRQITASMPGVRVLALTAEAEAEALVPVLRAGGSGLVHKTTAHDDIIPALAAVARDEVFLYPTGNRLLLSDFLREHEAGPLQALSEQERQILRLAAEGFNSTETGKKLFLSPKTIDSYRSRLMRQLGLTRRSDLVQLALRSGLLTAEPARESERTSRTQGQPHSPALPTR